MENILHLEKHGRKVGQRKKKVSLKIISFYVSVEFKPGPRPQEGDGSSEQRTRDGTWSPGAGPGLAAQRGDGGEHQRDREHREPGVCQEPGEQPQPLAPGVQQELSDPSTGGMWRKPIES